jgi:two-component system response regulator AtoC
VRAIGSEQPRKIDVRIIAATNKNLDKMVQDGSFREDLYFRLNVFQIPLPSLQQRKEDLPELIRHFIQKESRKMGISESIEVRPAAMQSLLTYGWPGNVRELQNVLARSLILSENGVIEVSDLPQNIRSSEYLSEQPSSGGQDSLKRQLRNYEQAIIKAAIEEANGDRKVAADRLGIGVSSLYRKLDSSIEA